MKRTAQKNERGGRGLSGSSVLREGIGSGISPKRPLASLADLDALYLDAINGTKARLLDAKLMAEAVRFREAQEVWTGSGDDTMLRLSVEIEAEGLARQRVWRRWLNTRARTA